MKKLLLLLPLVLIPGPAKALTWGEFWAPFTYPRTYYYAPPVYYVSPVIPMCDARVEHQAYVPGPYGEPGVIKTWSQWVRVPCY